MSRPSASTGHPAEIEQGCPQQRASGQSETAAAARYVPGAAWITQAMIEDTRRVWSPHYGYELPDAESVEILMNVRRFARVLLGKGGQL